MFKLSVILFIVINITLQLEFSSVTFFIKHKDENIKKIHQILKDVSDPDSPHYGQFLSHEEVIELQRPSQDHVMMVQEHLDSIGVKYEMSLAQDKITAQIPTHKVLTDSIDDHKSKLNYLLPQHLQNVVDTVSGLMLPWKNQADKKVRSKKSKFLKLRDNEDCLKDFVTPNCIKTAYGLENYVGTQSSNKQMVIVNQSFQQSDLDQFFKKYNMASQKCAKTIGDLTGQGQIEASLDMEYIMTTGQNIPTWWFYINGHIDNPFASWLTWSSNNKDIPFVHSLSVGGSEKDFADSNGGDIAITRMNNEMVALGTRGVSILFASGDSGYQPILKYGASSPFVTSVGGIFNGELKDQELQVDFISTGGISSMKPNGIQDYQKNAVAQYMKTSGKRPSNIDIGQRFVPDISAYDDAIEIVADGKENDVSGTSASTPIVAGMISLINDELIKLNLTPLGFLNPFLYKNADLFYDIKKGGNNGIDAVQGYDPASGLGTFDSTTFKKLLDAAITAKQKIQK